MDNTEISKDFVCVSCVSEVSKGGKIVCKEVGEGKEGV